MGRKYFGTDGIRGKANAILTPLQQNKNNQGHRGRVLLVPSWVPGLLPVLLVGGGIYWLVRRKRTPSS